MTQSSNGNDSKVVRPAAFRVSRASDLRKYFNQDDLVVKWKKVLQGQIADAVDEIGIGNVEMIICGDVLGYLEMLKKHGPE